MVFGSDGKLYMTIGERQEEYRAQDGIDHGGKVIRLNEDGSVPDDNPFIGRDDMLPEIFALVYLARQIAMSNRMARAEAYRMPNSDLNAMNATFSTIPAFNAGLRKVLSGAMRQDLEEEEKSVVDAYLVSITNIYNQLTREIREGILPGDAYKNFGARGLLKSPYFRDSWPIYRKYLGVTFVEEFEKMFDLDPSLETPW